LSREAGVRILKRVTFKFASHGWRERVGMSLSLLVFYKQ